MRFLLACLLALTLSLNPMIGFAAAMDCDQSMSQSAAKASSMAGMDMAGMDMSAKGDTSKSTPDQPCCPHPMKDCAKACAAMGAATIGLPPADHVATFFATTPVKLAASNTFAASFKPPQLDRPPRTTA